MYRNYTIAKSKPTPSEIADKVRARIGVSLDDASVFRLCEEAVFLEPAAFSLSVSECARLIRMVFACLRSELEVLQELSEDPSVSEIMVNGLDYVFVEKDGKLVQTNIKMDSEKQLRQIIQRLCAKVGREFNDLNPIVDARLEDGSRLNAVNSNIAIDGPILTIRKFTKSRLSMDQLTQSGSISRDAADFVKDLVCAGYNIFVSGGTSSGKTTFLNILSDYIPPWERLIVIEDSAELQIRAHKNLVRMEAKSSNVAGAGAVSIKDLIKTSLRMRPDRIIVGEVRGDEVVDMLAAMSTGHDGSLSTGHANSPKGIIGRLESMYISCSSFPLDAVRAQISEAIEIIIQMKRFPDGSRKVIEICEIAGLENGEIKFNKLFEYKDGEGLKRTDNKHIRDDKMLFFKSRNINDG